MKKSKFHEFLKFYTQKNNENFVETFSKINRKISKFIGKSMKFQKNFWEIFCNFMQGIFEFLISTLFEQRKCTIFV